MRNPLHILVLSSWYPTPEQPFLGNFVKRHVDLIATRHKVTVLNLQSDDVIQGIAITKNQQGNLTEVFARYPDSRNPFIKWRNARKAFRQACKEIRNVDLIHGNVILSKGLQFVWAKKHYKKPLIVTEHGSYFRQEKRENWSFMEKLTVRKVFKHADIITAVSPFLQSEIQVAFPGKSISILPNVIDPEVFSWQPETVSPITTFIHVSTLDERFKNVKGILDACKELKNAGASFRMRIVSDEPYTMWQQYSKEASLEAYVSFGGPMSADDVAHEMRSADALVLFSNYETFSCVVAEAWATGIPVISTPVGIARNMEQETGIQVEINDTEGLAAAMQRVISGNTAFDSAKTRERSSAYFPEKVLDVIEDIYQSVI